MEVKPFAFKYISFNFQVNFVLTNTIMSLLPAHNIISFYNCLTKLSIWAEQTQ